MYGRSGPRLQQQLLVGGGAGLTDVSGHTWPSGPHVQRYEGQLALVDVAGKQRNVNVGMLPETFAPGDWVIIRMGFVVRNRPGRRRAGDNQLEFVGRGRDDD